MGHPGLPDSVQQSTTNGVHRSTVHYRSRTSENTTLRAYLVRQSYEIRNKKKENRNRKLNNIATGIAFSLSVVHLIRFYAFTVGTLNSTKTYTTPHTAAQKTHAHTHDTFVCSENGNRAKRKSIFHFQLT